MPVHLGQRVRNVYSRPVLRLLHPLIKARHIRRTDREGQNSTISPNVVIYLGVYPGYGAEPAIGVECINRELRVFER